jgi:hypothetical protein
MSGPPTASSVSGSIRGASGQTAIGTNIRQNAVFLTVDVSPGDPAALDRVAQQIRLDPIADRVTAWGRDFPDLIGRDDVVSAVRDALEGRGSVAAFGDDGIGKSVLLRHVARRAGTGFTRGVALIPAGGMLWQDICQEVIRSFYRAELPIHLGPSQARAVLGDLDALLLFDDVDPDAGVEQLFSLVENASFVVASTERLLAGESRAVHLDGLDASGTEALIRATLVNLGAQTAVDPEVAASIGLALDGHPGRIIRAIEEAHERHVDLPRLAAELTTGVDQATASLGRLAAGEQAVVDAVAALEGAPIGHEHVAAVVSAASTDTVNDLERRRILRAASPRVRLDPDTAAAHLHWSDDPDAIRARYVDHFVAWAGRGAETAEAVADESRAILYLLDWAERTGRPDAAWTLSTATEGAFALANRWGAWARATGYRLRAAEKLGLDADAAVALNQIGVQALGGDATLRAREAFAEARDRALAVGEPAVAAVAGRNLEIVDGFLGPPGEDEPPDDGPDTGDEGPATTGPTNGLLSRPLFLLGLGGIIAVVALIYLFLIDRQALAIEPAAHVFQAAFVDADGERVAFTVTNRGAGTLEALDVGLAGDAAGEFYIVGGDCPGLSLLAGKSCSVELLFHPTRAGEGRATLSITARDGTVVSASVQSLASEPTESPTEAPTSEPSPSASPSRPVGQPDLAIASFVPTGVPERGDVNWLVPVDVVIVNAGTRAAGRFPIVITADGKPVPFDVPGENPIDLVTRAPLGPHETIRYTGRVWLPLDARLETVSMVVRADSCLRTQGAPPHCRLAEPSESNNSHPLQVVDLQVANLKVGEPQEPVERFAIGPSLVHVPVAFDLRNAGTQPATEFWIAAFIGQSRRYLYVPDLEFELERKLPRVRGLEAGDLLHVEGMVAVPRNDLGSPLTIVIGCPPSSEPCQLPEIALENNTTSAPIPPLPTPSPSPTPPPIF